MVVEGITYIYVYTYRVYIEMYREKGIERRLLFRVQGLEIRFRG